MYNNENTFVNDKLKDNIIGAINIIISIDGWDQGKIC